MRCGDLGLFLSSFVLKRRKYFALIHMSYKLSMVKASIYFSFFFLFLFFFNLSPLLTWNDGQRISSPIMVFRSIVHKNRNIKKNRFYSSQTREKFTKSNWPISFRSKIVSRGVGKFLELDKNLLWLTSDGRKRRSHLFFHHLSSLEVISHLSSLAKICYWVRNIPNLG